MDGNVFMIVWVKVGTNNRTAEHLNPSISSI